MKDRSKGLLIILTGVLIISPDAVLTRFMNEGGADPWTTVFWKMLFAAPVSTSFAIYEAGGPKPMWKSIVDARAYYAVVMPLQAALDTCFVLSFFYTTAANALLLINLNPLWCAIAGRLLLGDILPHRTYIALVLALGSVLVIFVPQILDRNNDNQDEFDVDLDFDFDLDLDLDFDNNSNSNGDAEGRALAGPSEIGEASALGNFIALFTGLGLATYITIVRHASMRAKPKNLIGSTAGGIFIAMMTSLIVRKGEVLPASYWTGEMWQFWLASIGQGISVGILFVTITIAPRLITGAEVGLCVLLEAVLGPLFVYFAYGNAPSNWTILGGSLLLVVLAIHESIPLCEIASKSFRKKRASDDDDDDDDDDDSIVKQQQQQQQQQQPSNDKLASDNEDDDKLIVAPNAVSSHTNTVEMEQSEC